MAEQQDHKKEVPDVFRNLVGCHKNSCGGYSYWRKMKIKQTVVPFLESGVSFFLLELEWWSARGRAPLHIQGQLSTTLCTLQLGAQLFPSPIPSFSFPHLSAGCGILTIALARGFFKRRQEDRYLGAAVLLLTPWAHLSGAEWSSKSMGWPNPTESVYSTTSPGQGKSKFQSKLLGTIQPKHRSRNLSLCFKLSWCVFSTQPAVP